MPTLEELLRASLQGANEKFDEANRTLHAAVVEAAKAVEAATDGKATLRLEAVGNTVAGKKYQLVIVVKGASDKRTLTYFNVTKNGFPIHRSSNVSLDTGEEQFDSLAALASYFQKLASDVDSPLVGYLAYIMRNQAVTAAEE